MLGNKALEGEGEDGDEKKEQRRELQVMLMLNIKVEIQILSSKEGGLEGWLEEKLGPSPRPRFDPL